MAIETVEVRADQFEDGGVKFTLKFPDGDTREFELARESELFGSFAAFGFNKKIREQTAGHINNMPLCKQKVDTILKAFEEGRFYAHRDAETGPAVGYLAQALMRLYEVDEEAAQAQVSSLSRQQQSELREDPQIALAIADIKAEEKRKKGKGQEASGLLASIGERLRGAPQALNVEDSVLDQ